MADFQTHIATSTVVGIGYGIWGYTQGAPIETSALAAGLCSVSGMLPDLDSDSGRPAREMITFVAAVLPAMMLERFRRWGIPSETIVLITGGLYFAIRFGIGNLFKRFTVHRGMWHSVPACLISGLLTFLMVHRDILALRYYIAAAVMLGFASHLILDEIWSISFNTTKIGLKKSYGTAMKFFSDSPGANLVCYAGFVLLAAAAVGDPMVMERYGYVVPYNTPELRQEARQFIRDEVRQVRQWVQEQQGTLPQQPTSPWQR